MTAARLKRFAISTALFLFAMILSLLAIGASYDDPMLVYKQISIMVGASAGTAGKPGAVPAPAAGDQGKALLGNGTWGSVSGGVESPCAVNSTTSITGWPLSTARGGTGRTTGAIESPCVADTTTSVTGAWPISKGGTGQTTQVAAIAALTETPCTMGDATQRTITAPDTSTRVTIKVDTDGANNTGSSFVLNRRVTNGTDAGYFARFTNAANESLFAVTAAGIVYVGNTSSYYLKLASGTHDRIDGSESADDFTIAKSADSSDPMLKFYGGTGASARTYLLQGHQWVGGSTKPNACRLTGARGVSNSAGGGDVYLYGGPSIEAGAGPGGSAVLAASNGSTKRVEVNDTGIGFFGVTPVAQAAAITQTYSTADRTHAALTSATLTDSSGGTPGTTIAAIGASYTQAEVANAVASLAAQVNALRVDLEDTKQLLNAVIDDLQAYGLEQ